MQTEILSKTKIEQSFWKLSGKWENNESLNEGADLQFLIKNKNYISVLKFHWYYYFYELVFVQNKYCTNLKRQP